MEDNGHGTSRTTSAWVGWVVLRARWRHRRVLQHHPGAGALFDDQYFVVAKGDLLLLDYTGRSTCWSGW